MKSRYAVWTGGLYLLTSLVLGLGSVPALAEDGPAEILPDFSGIWILDEHLSDDPQAILEEHREKMTQQRGSREGRGGGMGGGRGGGMSGGMGGRGGTGGRGGGLEYPDMRRQRPGPFGEGYRQLLIAHQGEFIEIIDAEDKGRSWRIGGNAMRHEGARGETTTRALWRDDTLVILTYRDDEETLRRTYTLARDGSRLTQRVEMRLPLAKDPVTFVLIYRMAE